MSDATTTAVPIAFRERVAPEDVARADFYALMARLFAAAPDAKLLRDIAAAPSLAPATVMDEQLAGTAAGLAEAWDTLRAASSVMDPEAAEQEYLDLFVGVGPSEVNLHASHWLSGFMMEKPLVDIRADLAELGLSARPGSPWVEDHLSSLCETMRALIMGVGEVAPAPLELQRTFCERHLLTWIHRCCDAIEHAAIANYYRRVAEFVRAFMAVERDSLAME